ncbi:Protein WHAT'S THIS FACTOR 1-like protein [Bienertia sinuspersici]
MLIKSKVARFVLQHPNPTNFQCIRTFLDNIEIQFVRDRGLDHVVEREKDLKFVVNLKNLLKSEPSKSLHLSSIVDNSEKLRIPCRAIDFIRKYPSFFEEYFPGYVGIHPHVRLTPESLNLDAEEQIIYGSDTFRKGAADRLLKLLMLCRVNEIPLQLIDRLKWDLGLPDDYVDALVREFSDYFRLKKVNETLIRSNRVKGLLEIVCWSDELSVSVAEKRAMKEASGYQKGMPIAFPLQYSKGFEMDKKLKKWVDEWKRLPYVSPYENSSHFSPNSDMSDRWAVAILHELLHILVPKKTERDNLLCFREYLGIKPRIKQALAHHPGIFYRSSKNGTHTVVVRDGYKRDLLIDNHPLMDMRSKYIHLMHKVKEVKKTISVPSSNSAKQQITKEGVTEKKEANGKGLEGETQISDPDVDASSDEDYDEDEEEENEEQVERSRARHKAGGKGSGERGRHKRNALRGETSDDDEEEEAVESSRGRRKDGKRGYGSVNEGRGKFGYSRGRPIRNASRHEGVGDDEEEKQVQSSRGGHNNGKRGYSKVNGGREKPREDRGRPGTGRYTSRYEGGNNGEERVGRSRGGANDERRGFGKVSGNYGDRERVERSRDRGNDERRGFNKVNEDRRKPGEGRGRPGGDDSR